MTAHTRDDLRQHHPDCELDHPVCAILLLAGRIAVLEQRLAGTIKDRDAWKNSWHNDTRALEDETERLWNGIVKHRDAIDPNQNGNVGMPEDHQLWRLIDHEEHTDA